MKFILKIFLILLITAGIAFSQNGGEWAIQVKNLKNRIEFLKRTAARYQAPKALQLLRQASDDLQQAYQKFQHLKFKQAWMLFKKAEKEVRQAEKLLYYKPTARAYFEAEKLLQRAERLAENSGDKTARYLVIRGKAFLLEAVRAYQNGRIVKAQEFQRIAIYFANKALDLTQGQSALPVSGQKIDRQLNELRMLRSEVVKAAQNNPDVEQLLRKADLFLKRAKDLYEKNDLRKALVQMQIGERLLYRALDLSQQTGLGERERIRNNLMSLEQYIQSIEENVSDKPAAVRILRKARQFYRAARRDYENEHFRAAASKIGLAQKLATKALNYSDLASDTDFDSRLREVQQLLTLQEKNRQQGQPENEILKTEVQKLINGAVKNHQAGRDRIALWELNVAVRLLNRMITPASGQSVTQIDGERLHQKYQRYLNIWQKMQEKNSLDAEELKVIHRLLILTEKQLKAQNYRTVKILLDMIYQQLNFFATKTRA